MTTYLVYLSSTQQIEVDAEEIFLNAGVVSLLVEGKSVAVFVAAQIVGIVERDRLQPTSPRPGQVGSYVAAPQPRQDYKPK